MAVLSTERIRSRVPACCTAVLYNGMTAEEPEEHLLSHSPAIPVLNSKVRNKGCVSARKARLDARGGDLER